MAKVIKVLEFTGHGAKTGLRPNTYIESFDFEAHHGRGFAMLTDNKAKAQRFDDAAAAFRFWKTQSTTVPLRSDGKPNRPLTSCTIEIENADD